MVWRKKNPIKAQSKASSQFTSSVFMALDIVITDIPVIREWSGPQISQAPPIELPALIHTPQVDSYGEQLLKRRRKKKIMKKIGESTRGRTKRKAFDELRNPQKQCQKSSPTQATSGPVLNNCSRRNGNLVGIRSSRINQEISPKSSRATLFSRTATTISQPSKEMNPPSSKSHMKGNKQHRRQRQQQIKEGSRQRISTMSTTGGTHKLTKSSISAESNVVRQGGVQRNSKSAPAKCGPRSNQSNKCERNAIVNRVSYSKDSSTLHGSRKNEYWLKKAMKERLREEIYAKNRLMKFLEERRWKILEMNNLDTAVDDGSFAV